MTGAREPFLTVIVPTRDRKQVLSETLDRVAEQSDAETELVVVDDEPGNGPAAARNLGIERARGEVLLFLDDDVTPGAGMLQRHLDFHRRRPQRTEALLGRITPAPAFDSELARWAHERGAIFAYAELSAERPVPPTRFWTAQVSVKDELIREVGGFDEQLRFFEDVELAHRLTQAGMRIAYDPEALGEHSQEITVAGLMARARASAAYFERLAQLVPGTALPARPGARHRVKAAALTMMNGARVRPRWVRHASWRFLVDEAQREAFWGSKGGGLDIGASLERLALDRESLEATSSARTQL